MRERGGEVLLRVVRRNRGDTVEIFLCQLTAVCVAQDEKTSGKRRFRGERSLMPCDLVIGRGLRRLRIVRTVGQNMGVGGIIGRRRCVRIPLWGKALIGDGAGIFIDERQRLLQVGIGRDIVCRVQDDGQQQHDRRNGEHRDADEAAAQLFDHACSSSA